MHKLVMTFHFLIQYLEGYWGAAPKNTKILEKKERKKEISLRASYSRLLNNSSHGYSNNKSRKFLLFLFSNSSKNRWILEIHSPNLS